MNDNTYDKSLFNIDLLSLNNDIIKNIGEVKDISIFNPSSRTFKSNGLFSTEIFGQVGSNERLTRFGYIDLKCNVLHPLLYRTITSLSNLYKEILEGKINVKFDDNKKDFYIDENGETGYSFFIKNFENVNLSSNNSKIRDFKIKFIKKYLNSDYLVNKWLVSPAGLRDYTIDDRGVPSEDEVNVLYRKLLIRSSILDNISTKIESSNMKFLDDVLLTITKTLVEIYEHYETLLSGKHKFIQGKWSKRAVSISTRNVLTPSLNNLKHLDDERYVSNIHVTIGVYQYIKAILPITVNKVISTFISNIFFSDTSSVMLINPDTYKSELVNVESNIRNEWMSKEGINNIINKLSQDDLFFSYFKISGYYPYIVIDDNNEVIILNNIENIPDKYKNIDLKKDNRVRPLTYLEMFYIAIYDCIDIYPLFNTRYPVTGLGSIFPSKAYVKTTISSRTVNIMFNTINKKVYEYPIIGSELYRTVSFPIFNLSRMSGDHDGDVVSVIALYTDDSIKEINNLLNNKVYYLGTDGKLTYSFSSNNVSELVLKHMTSEPILNKGKEDSDDNIAKVITDDISNSSILNSISSDNTISPVNIINIKNDIGDYDDYSLKYIYCSFDSELDETIIKPSIPINPLTIKNIDGYSIGDNKTNRVILYPSIEQCVILYDTPRNLKSEKLFIYSVLNLNKDYLIKPNIEQAPNIGITHELWYTKPIKVKLEYYIKLLIDPKDFKSIEPLEYYTSDGNKMFMSKYKYVIVKEKK